MGKRLNNMNKILSIFVITLITIIILPFNVKAANIVTLDVENNSGKLTVSGTTESEVHAIAVLVYSGNDLVHMETCSNDEGYSCKLNKTFEAGTYTVKVADYDGGDYIIQEVEVTAEENPKTFDNILISVIAFVLSIVSLIFCGLYIYKKKSLN